jgi:hypothetical protein
MANKREDAAAAKAKKQKIVLVVGGVLLLALAAIQGPKLLKGSSAQPQATPAVAAADTTVPTTVSASPSASSDGSAVVVRASGPRATAVLAGITIQGGGGSVADMSQLIRFNLFEVKDPFVPQASDKATGTTAVTGAAPASSTPPAATPPSAPPAQPAKASSPAPTKKPAVAKRPTTNATILLNGKANYVELKSKFPAANPLFVVTSLEPTVARIGVAGGAFKGSKTIALTKGKKMTLVNDETGARYVLKLVYTGPVPERTATFTQAGK